MLAAVGVPSGTPPVDGPLTPPHHSPLHHSSSDSGGGGSAFWGASGGNNTMMSSEGPEGTKDRFLGWLDNVDWREFGVGDEASGAIPFAKGGNVGRKTFRQETPAFPSNYLLFSSLILITVVFIMHLPPSTTKNNSLQH